MANKPWHRGNHPRLAKMVHAAAEADPTTRCARCGRTKQETAAVYGADSAKWVAGHKMRGAMTRSVQEYQPECARCSAQEGAAVRNARSSHGYDWP